MKTELLVDLTRYHPSFVRGAIGESDMVPHQSQYYVQVNLTIDGKTLPVSVDGVRCLDERYQEIVRLWTELQRDEDLRKLRSAKKIYHVVGPQGGNKGVVLWLGGSNSMRLTGQKEHGESARLLDLCEKNGIPFEKIKEDAFREVERSWWN